jgi:hypothetical protein
MSNQLTGNAMIVSSNPASFPARSLAVLRSVGAWMTIAPEQTYVATSIRGLGVCKSTYLKAERRELSPRTAMPGVRAAALLAVAVAVSGLLSGFTAHRMPAEARDMAEPDQLGPRIADCQKSAAPVSSGAATGEVTAAGPVCDGSAAVAAVEAARTTPGYEAMLAEPAATVDRIGAAGRVGFAGG